MKISQKPFMALSRPFSTLILIFIGCGLGYMFDAQEARAQGVQTAPNRTINDCSDSQILVIGRGREHRLMGGHLRNKDVKDKVSFVHENDWKRLLRYSKVCLYPEANYAGLNSSGAISVLEQGSSDADLLEWYRKKHFDLAPSSKEGNTSLPLTHLQNNTGAEGTECRDTPAREGTDLKMPPSVGVLLPVAAGKHTTPKFAPMVMPPTDLSELSRHDDERRDNKLIPSPYVWGYPQ